MSSENDREMVPLPGLDGEPLLIPDYTSACLLQGILAGSGIEAVVPPPSKHIGLPLVMVPAGQALEAAQIAAAATIGSAEAAEAAERAGEAAGDRPPEDYRPEPDQTELGEANPAQVRIL